MSDNLQKIILTTSTLLISLTTIYITPKLFPKPQRPQNITDSTSGENDDHQIEDENNVKVDDKSSNKKLITKITNLNYNLNHIQLELKQKNLEIEQKNREIELLNLQFNRLQTAFELDNYNLKKLKYLLSKSYIFSFIWNLSK